jgi:hypothetical protein
MESTAPHAAFFPLMSSLEVMLIFLNPCALHLSDFQDKDTDGGLFGQSMLIRMKLSATDINRER